MLPDLDLFALYRWLLLIVCTVYTVIRLGQTLRHWIEFLWAPEYGRRTLRRYTAVALLRVRLGRFAWPLVQIAGLTAALGVLMILHQRLGLLR